MKTIYDIDIPLSQFFKPSEILRAFKKRYNFEENAIAKLILVNNDIIMAHIDDDEYTYEDLGIDTYVKDGITYAKICVNKMNTKLKEKGLYAEMYRAVDRKMNNYLLIIIRVVP